VIKLKSVEVSVYRYPLETIVQTSFGTMYDRPMVLVKLTDEDDFAGVGEVWCNFPAVGAEHRARLIESVFKPLLTGKLFDGPAKAFDLLTKKTWVLGLQTGEFGPIAQCIAGIDIAFHDLMARRDKTPLWKYLGGVSDSVKTYASGINPTNAEKTAETALEAGHQALKLKIGFDLAQDIQNIKSLRALLGKKGQLMVDANQAWTVNEAKEMMQKIAAYDIKWLEEPIHADRPDDEWRSVKASGNTPLAGGENIMGDRHFNRLIEAGYLSVIQPDLAKWGGLTETVPVARKIIAAGIRYCPHYLGGGIGLLASAHALAAVGGNGVLEFDINKNPLRSIFVDACFKTSSSLMKLGDSPGLGVEVDFRDISKHRVQ
jgi:D-galactarolactone cycloisomerase